MNWITITEQEQIQAIFDSKDFSIIYKHSPRCMTSLMAYRQLKSEVSAAAGEETPIYIVDVIGHRQVSQAIAQTFHVEHESPQIMVIKNGQSVYDTSHENVSLKEALMHVN